MTLRRVLGALLLATVLLPAHRLLDPDRTGLAGSATRAAAEAAWSTGLLGTLLVAAAALLLARLGPAGGLRPGLGRLSRTVVAVPGPAWAAAMGALSFLLAAAAGLLLFGGLPTTVDAMVQLLHAQALRAGSAALDLPGPAAAWLVQNGLLTGAGWASVYPPGHTAVLALGLAAGLPWLVGPLGAGAASALTALSLDRLLTGHRAVARWASLVAAVAPFLLLLGGTHLSHTTAAALTALVVWSALRARDGRAAWSLLVGGAVGALVCTRPWTGLVLGATLPLAVWLGAPRRPRPVVLVRRTALTVAGGAPFAAALLAWNHHLFGHPLRLGYTAAFGPAHGLGLHTDPWGNAYGLLEAAGYTGADLLLLGTHLLETPLPALALVGLALVVAPRLLPGAGVLLAWGGATVAANAAYWHHGIHLGPRLLYESAPAWSALVVVSVAALLDRAGRRGDRWRAGVAWAAAVAGVGAVLLLPGRLDTVAALSRATAGATAPPAPDAPALVLVHGSWPSRVAARLAATGMRRDSVETVLRRNDLCLAHVYARWRSVGVGDPPPVEVEPLPGPGERLRPVEISPGSRALLDPDRPLASDCAREARADAVAGTVELEPLLWRAPPLPGAPVLLARDLGPRANRLLLETHPTRTPWVMVEQGPGGRPGLLPYEAAMVELWGAGGSASASGIRPGHPPATPDPPFPVRAGG